MNPALPAVKPRKLIKILEKVGFYKDHQTGSHVFLKHQNHKGVVCVPFHNKDLKRGTLHSILKQANLPVEKLLELL